MAKYRKRPVAVDAVQWTGNKQSWDEIMDMNLAPNQWAPGEIGTDTFYIKTPEGDHLVRMFDFVIKGVKGEFYACKPDIFELTYEPDQLRERIPG